MTTDDAPSRRDFEYLAKTLERLTHTIEELPDKMAALYVRLDNYDRDQRLHAQKHADQDKDISGLQKIVNVVIGFVFAAVGTALLAAVLR